MPVISLTNALTTRCARWGQKHVGSLALPVMRALYCKGAHLGLAQRIKTKDSVSTDEAEVFLDSICKDLSFTKQKFTWVIHSFNKRKMSFEIQIVQEGFYIHRSGEYFEFLGFFIEHLTGEFGTVTIEDV